MSLVKILSLAASLGLVAANSGIGSPKDLRSRSTTADVAFNEAYIVEFDSAASQDYSKLYEDVKQSLVQSHGADCTILTRQEYNSPLFRGASFNVSCPTSESSKLGPNNVQGSIQSLKSVQQTWPVRKLHLNSPVRTKVGIPVAPNHTEGSVLSRRDEDADESLADTFSTHVMTGVDRLHAEGKLAQNVTIAILDSGFDYLHDALLGKEASFGPGEKVVYGHSFIEGTDSADPYDDCSLHGTHVFGIIGASPAKFNVSGVASGASYKLYRVTACDGSVNNDDIIQYSLFAYEQGADIMTCSIGGSASYPEEAWAAVVQRINEAGVFFSWAGGNSGPGAYTSADPANGFNVPAIGSIDNTVTPHYYLNASWSVSANDTANQESGAFKYMPSAPASFPSNLKLWSPSLDMLEYGLECVQLNVTDIPDMSETLYIQRSDVCLLIGDQLAADAVAAEYQLIFTPQTQDPAAAPLFYEYMTEVLPLGIGVADWDAGVALMTALKAGGDVTVTLANPNQNGGYYEGSVVNYEDSATGGKMSYFTSWGPTLDGRTYPTFSAPGGNILSLFPRNMGGYGVMSGTSMATPFAAGVAALVKQAHADFDGQTIRNVLATTSRPVKYSNDLLDAASNSYDFLAPVFQQGAGLVDAYAAVNVRTLVNVSALSFNDSAAISAPATLGFSIKNLDSAARTYALSHVGAASGHAFSEDGRLMMLSSQIAAALSTDYADVEITPATVTVQPGEWADVSVTVKAVPANMTASRLPFFGGFISMVATGEGDDESLSLPYTGFATPLATIPIIDRLFTEPLMVLMTSSGGLLEAVDTSVTRTFNLTYAPGGQALASEDNTYPAMALYFTLQGRYSAIDLVNAVTDEVVIEADYYQDVLTGWKSGFYWWFDGTDGNATFVPAGTYKWRARALKLNGHKDVAGDWDIWESPAWNLAYTNPASELPA